MQKTKLHIVSFDVPYPPDYGGAIDVFYKIKSLAEAGAEIYLHCYEYGRQHAPILEEFCEQVWYYTRETGINGLSLKLPYIVYSRRNKALLSRLININAPILFEGLHTTYFLNNAALADRFKIIRNHNIEHQYYKLLEGKETNIFKKAFFNIESSLLRKYERTLNAANGLLSLSIADDAYFGKEYPNTGHAFMAPFHPYKEVTTQAGTGSYCLYHGNLAHPENQEAAMYLINKVIPQTTCSYIFAGRNPSKKLKQAIKNNKNCRLISNPTAIEMDRLIANAQINILPTFQATGMKLKLLYALFGGRHILVNNAMIHGTSLDHLCSIANDSEGFAAKIAYLINKPFTQLDIQERNSQLMEHYSNQKNAARLITYFREKSL